MVTTDLTLPPPTFKLDCDGDPTATPHPEELAVDEHFIKAGTSPANDYREWLVSPGHRAYVDAVSTAFTRGVSTHGWSWRAPVK